MNGMNIDQIRESISNALSLFAENLGSLEKAPLAIPEISVDSDDSDKRSALRSMLKLLASDSRDRVLSDEDIDHASSFFAKLYGGENRYRHRYADVCDFVFTTFKETKGELDDGVPYSVNCLAENIGIIYEHMASGNYADQAKSVLKLADHIDLEKTRLKHFIEQRAAIVKFEEAVEKMHAERKEAEKERGKLESEFNERLDETRMEYIAILGVFSAVVLAFNGAIGFSDVSISALGTTSGLRALVFITAMVGFVLINAICILLVFLWKMSFNHKKIELGGWPRNCIITADVVLMIIMLAAVAMGHPSVRSFFGM